MTEEPQRLSASTGPEALARFTMAFIAAGSEPDWLVLLADPQHDGGERHIVLAVNDTSCAVPASAVDKLLTMLGLMPGKLGLSEHEALPWKRLAASVREMGEAATMPSVRQH